MKEVYLYMCEDCGTVVCNKQDHDKTCYANYCAGCKQGSFFKKVVLAPAYDMWGVFQGNRFTLEEKKDEHSNTRTDQEK